MKTGIKSLSIAASAVIFFSGCSKEEEQPALTEADVNEAAQEAAQEAQAESDQKLGDKLASGFADIKKSSEDEIAKAKEEMQAEFDSKLAAQKEALIAEFEKNNQALSDQVEALSSQYSKVEDDLPENVASSFQEKLPQLKSSVQNLQTLVARFSPESMEQLQEFQTKYQKEFATAKEIGQQLMQMLNTSNTGASLPQL